MKFILESTGDYLQSDRYMDFNDESIRQKTHELLASLPDEKEKIKAAFEYVRDEISHSGDIGSGKMPRTASEALKHKEGICIAKAYLLAALLRCAGIPAGLCYQRLTRGDTPDTLYVTHGLNAVFLSAEQKWFRLDARGNKQGVNAQFSTGKEQLAFPIRLEYNEIDYPTIYARPHGKIIEAMEKYQNYDEYMAGNTELYRVST